MHKKVQIDFDAPAGLGKWPSFNNERVSAFLSARRISTQPYRDHLQ
jgi:hypothetical protein